MIRLIELTSPKCYKTPVRGGISSKKTHSQNGGLGELFAGLKVIQGDPGTIKQLFTKVIQ